MSKKVVIEILADVGNAIAGIGKVGGALDNLGNSTKNVGGKMADFGKSMAVVTTVPIVGALAAATKVALDFDTQIGDAGRALDLSGKQLDNFKSQVLNTAPALGQMPTKFAEIATEAGKLGIASDKILDFSKLVSKGVMATGADAVELAKNLAAVQTITGASAGQLEKLVAAANKVDDAIGGSTPEILEFVRQTAASGKLLNINTKQLAAYGGAMQSLGIQNGVAYRSMNKLMTTLAAPQVLAPNQIEGLNALGISATEMAARMKESGSGGVQFFLEKVKLIATTDPQRALGAVKQLIGADFGDEVLTSALAVDKFSQALKYAGDDAGNLAKFQGEVEKKLAGSAGQIQIFQANLAKIGIIVGTAILPALNQLLAAVIPVLENFGKFAEANPKIVQVGVAVAGLVAAIAPLIIVIGSVISAVGTIMGAIGAAIPIIAGIGGAITTVIGVLVSAPVLIGVAIAAAVAAVVAAGYAIYKNWDWLKQQAGILWDAMGSAINSAVTNAVGFIKKLPEAIGYAVGYVATTIALMPVHIANALAKVVLYILDNKDKIIGAVKQTIDNVTNTVSKFVTAIPGVVMGGINAIARAFQSLPGKIVGALQATYSAVTSAFGQVMKYIGDVGNWCINALKSAGVGMMQGFANGIISAASAPFNAIKEVVDRVRAYLPGSDAKLGALSDLTASGRALPQTFALGMTDTNPIDRAANAVASAALPQPQKAPLLAGSSGSISITANFQPTINLSGTATENDARRIIEELRPYAREFLVMLEQQTNRMNRTAY